jgi:uncharacterized membrane protein
MQNIKEKTALGFDDNVGALICYVGNFVCSFGLIYSIIVIVTNKTNKFARFHAFQSILCSVIGLIFGLGAVIGGAIGGVIDGLIGFPLLTLVIGLVVIVIGIIGLISFIRAAINAFKGEIYKITFIGTLADKWS